jgi:tetratricopeptide (TPR) repeat protein
MARIEKTVFISYRRADEPWALAVFENLTQHGYDVFIDYDGIASGSFETAILENIKARAHFLVLLTPTALERCGDPKDWMRREIEAALDSQRNIVPLMLAGFDFGKPAVAGQLTGKLAALKEYNGLEIPKGYFSPAMERLRNKFLSVSLDTVLHPASLSAQQAATEQKDKATMALGDALHQPWLSPEERREAEPRRAAEAERRRQQEAEAKQHEDQEERRKIVEAEKRRQASNVLGNRPIAEYTEMIRLDPKNAQAFFQRGTAYHTEDDYDRAVADYTEAIRLDPTHWSAFMNRSVAYRQKNDYDRAIADCTEAIRLGTALEKWQARSAFFGRGFAYHKKNDYDRAIADYTEAIRLDRKYADAFYWRGRTKQMKGDASGGAADISKAKKLDRRAPFFKG